MENLSAPLNKLYFDNWFSRPDDSSLWVRIYSACGVSQSSCQDILLRELHGGFQSSESNLLCGVIVPDQAELPSTHQIVGSTPDGQIGIFAHIHNIKLPQTVCIVLSVPFTIDGNPGGEQRTKQRLDSFASLLSLTIGKNIVRDLLFDGEVHVGSGQFTLRGTANRVPQPCEGPFTAAEGTDGLGTLEVWKTLSAADAVTQDRVNLATEFFHSGQYAARSYEELFFKWTALEILAQGKAQKIKSLIAKIYQRAGLKDAVHNLHVQELARMRHDLTHHGVRPNLTAEISRLLDCLIIDCLRDQLGLEPKFFAQDHVSKFPEGGIGF